MRTIINLRTLKAVALAASTEATRYYLNGVLVQCRPDHVIYVATDGCRMLCCREEIAQPENLADGVMTGDFIIPTDICNAYKAGKAGRYSNDSLDLDELELLPDGKLAFYKAGRVFAPIDAKFPDWRRTLPSALSDEVAQFNLMYLATFAKAGALAGWGDFPNVLHNGNGPALIRWNDPKAFGVCMPIRGGDATWYPAWLEIIAP